MGLDFRIEQTQASPAVTPFGDVLRLSTDDPDDVGTMSVLLTLEPTDPSPAPAVTVQFIIILERCQLDTIEIVRVISGVDYSLGSGPLTTGPDLKNSFEEGAVTY